MGNSTCLSAGTPLAGSADVNCQSGLGQDDAPTMSIGHRAYRLRPRHQPSVLPASGVATSAGLIHRKSLFLPTGVAAYPRAVATFDVKLRDGTLEIVEGADAYQPDGQFTTFFAFEEGRNVVDCWSTRMASIRSAEIVAVWRRGEPAGAQRLRRPSAAA